MKVLWEYEYLLEASAHHRGKLSRDSAIRQRLVSRELLDLEKDCRSVIHDHLCSSLGIDATVEAMRAVEVDPHLVTRLDDINVLLPP
jgi:hypothetical protein